jgi:hypothetical protein
MKLSSPHSTYIDQAKKLLKFLDKNSNVSKISLGIIKPKKSASKSFTRPKATLTKNHILIKVSSKLAVQEIRIYGKNLEQILEEIDNF